MNNDAIKLFWSRYSIATSLIVLALIFGSVCSYKLIKLEPGNALGICSLDSLKSGDGIQFRGKELYITEKDWYENLGMLRMVMEVNNQ